MKLAPSIIGPSIIKLGNLAITVKSLSGLVVLNRSNVIPPISKVKIVLLSPHMLGTHVPRSVEIVVPGEALKVTNEMIAAAHNEEKYHKCPTHNIQSSIIKAVLWKLHSQYLFHEETWIVIYSDRLYCWGKF